MIGGAHVIMSRSYKKTGVLKDNDGAGKKRSWKKLFNRKLRRNKEAMLEMPSGNAYKKANNSYDISDFAFHYDRYGTYDTEDERYKWFMK